MKHSNKSYDSFQDELEDYIKGQKARGLEPKTCFRRMRDDYLGNCGCREEVDSRPRYRMFDPRLPSGTVPTSPRSCNSSQAVENRLPRWPPAHDSRLRLDSLSYCQFTRDRCSEKPGPPNFAQQEYSCASYSAGPGACPPQASPKPPPPRRKRHAEDERPKHERRRSSEEDSDRHKSLQRKKARAEAETVQASADRPRGRKERKSRDVASKKEERKRRKEKKEQGEERTEEEMLWDQSILGF